MVLSLVVSTPGPEEPSSDHRAAGGVDAVGISTRSTTWEVKSNDDRARPNDGTSAESSALGILGMVADDSAPAPIREPA